MRFFYTIILCCVASLGAYSQTNFKAGYVVKLNGDTVKGLIDQREWANSPSTVSFSNGATDGSKITYSPNDISGFGVYGADRFVVYNGKISIHKTDLLNLPSSLDTSTKTDVVFLKQVAGGELLNIYAYKDDIKTRFFAETPNQAPAELPYYVYYNADGKVVSSESYKGLLQIIATTTGKTEPSITALIRAANYDEQSMRSLANQINGVKADRSKKAFYTRTFVGASAAYSKTTLQVQEFPSNDKYSVSSIIPKLHFGIDVFSNPDVQKVIFRTELSLYYESIGVDMPSEYYHITSRHYAVDQFTASLTPQLLLNVYNKPTLKTYLMIGLAFNFSKYFNEKLTGQENISSPLYIEPGKINGFCLSPVAGLGVVVNKKSDISVSFSPSANFSTANKGFKSVNKSSIALTYRYYLN